MPVQAIDFETPAGRDEEVSRGSRTQRDRQQRRTEAAISRRRQDRQKQRRIRIAIAHSRVQQEPAPDRHSDAERGASVAQEERWAMTHSAGTQIGYRRVDKFCDSVARVASRGEGSLTLDRASPMSHIGIMFCRAMVAVALVLPRLPAQAIPAQLIEDASPYDRAAWKAKYVRPTSIPFPEDNRFTKERELLGRTLFFDPRLSGSKSISCATCHNPGFSWGDGLPRGIGSGM